MESIYWYPTLWEKFGLGKSSPSLGLRLVYQKSKEIIHWIFVTVIIFNKVAENTESVNTELCSQGKYNIRVLRASGHILIYLSIHNLVLCGFLLFNAYITLFNAYHLFINTELVANNPVSHAWVKLVYHVFSPIRHITAFCISIQFSSVAQSCLTVCDPMDCSMPGLPVHH